MILPEVTGRKVSTPVPTIEKIPAVKPVAIVETGQYQEDVCHLSFLKGGSATQQVAV